MIKDKLKLPFKGEIIITDAKTGQVLLQRDNAIQPYALTALINMLAGNSGYNPNSIKVWLTGSNIATALLDSFALDTVAHWVKLVAFFDALDFSGPLDELTLECLGGTFSQVTGLSFTKPADQAIYVTWKITTSL